MIRFLTHGVRNGLLNRVLGLTEMSSIPQDRRSIELGEEDLAKRVLPENRFYRQMSAENMERVRSAEKKISSAFNVWGQE